MIGRFLSKYSAIVASDTFVETNILWLYHLIYRELHRIKKKIKRTHLYEASRSDTEGNQTQGGQA